VSAGGKPGVEIVHVQRGPTAAGGLTHYLSHQIECLTQASGEGVLECEWRRFPFTGLREIGGKKSLDDDGGNFSAYRMGQTVATFDLGEEALSHEEALLFKGGRKHHIYPQLVSPACLAQRPANGRLGSPETQGYILPMRKLGRQRKRRKTESPRECRPAAGTGMRHYHGNLVEIGQCQLERCCGPVAGVGSVAIIRDRIEKVKGR